tara:strand:- start:3305 stop:3478 length:174 start_codon:yes stop_codon:yes gene_type:complete
MSKKNLITLAVVLVVGYLLWNMSKKQQGSQSCGQGQTWNAQTGMCQAQSTDQRRYRG